MEYFCKSVTKKGERCKKKSLPGEEFCHIHKLDKKCDKCGKDIPTGPFKDCPDCKAKYKKCKSCRKSLLNTNDNYCGKCLESRGCKEPGCKNLVHFIGTYCDLHTPKCSICKAYLGLFPESNVCSYCTLTVKCAMKDCTGIKTGSGYCFRHMNSDKKSENKTTIKYSKHNKTVIIGNKTFSIKEFVRLYIVPYLNKGIIGTNPYNISQKDAEFFIEKNNYEKPVETGRQSSFLKSLNILSKSDFKKWAIKNHPDKGGDTELFAKVSAEVEKIFDN